MKKTGLLIVVIFISALVASVWIQLILSPDFKGFGMGQSAKPEVTHQSGESGGKTNASKGSGYNWNGHPVFIVGDSLTEGARKEISKTVGDPTIDAQSGRTMATGLSILRNWEEAGILGDDAIIIVCLAHNITESTLNDAQQVVDMIKPGQSLIMMTGHGRGNMAPINEYIRGLPRAYSYITVADWDLTIAQSPALLSDDGVHVAKSQGNQLYADLILRALEVTRPMK